MNLSWLVPGKKTGNWLSCVISASTEEFSGQSMLMRLLLQNNPVKCNILCNNRYQRMDRPFG